MEIPTRAGNMSSAFLAILFFVCVGCAGYAPPAYQPLSNAVECGDPPQSVAVLPFINYTNIDGLEKEFRVSVFGQMTVLPYRDVELSEIDSKLEENGLMEDFAFTEVSIRELGRILRCDAVVLGEVKDFYRIFLGVYSRMSIEGGITIWDTRTGEKIWNETKEVSEHEGGIPLNILDLPLISVRSGYNLRNNNQEEIVEELAELLISRIPAPACFIADHKADVRYVYELQAGAYLIVDNAVKLEKYLERQGYPASIRSNWDEGGLWHKVFVGPYEERETALDFQKKIRESIGMQPIIAKVILSGEAEFQKIE